MSKESKESKKTNEYNEYKCLLTEVQNETLKNRIGLSLKYYIDKAILYKRLWNYLSILSIVLPASATFLACVIDQNECLKWLIPFITSSTTIIASLLTLFKCADKKNSYRESAEKLKSELNAYVNNCKDYAN
jgi:hypothetical protein